MSDQCANCDVRGHFDKCEGVECGHHENWYPNELKKQLVAAEQRIDELLSANGSLQYKNDRLTAKTQRLEVAEKMAREARAQLAAAEQRAEKAEKDLAATMVEVAEILHNRQAKIEALKQSERDAVRECEKIARESRLQAEAYNDERLLIVGCDGSIRNRYPQHFEEE